MLNKITKICLLVSMLMLTVSCVKKYDEEPNYVPNNTKKTIDSKEIGKQTGVFVNKTIEESKKFLEGFDEETKISRNVKDFTNTLKDKLEQFRKKGE